MCQDKNEVISYYRYIIIPGAGCIKKWLKLTMISANVDQSEPRILYLTTI